MANSALYAWLVPCVLTHNILLVETIVKFDLVSNDFLLHPYTFLASNYTAMYVCCLDGTNRWDLHNDYFKISVMTDESIKHTYKLHADFLIMSNKGLKDHNCYCTIIFMQIHSSST